jgi:hypothetical protein
MNQARGETPAVGTALPYTWHSRTEPWYGCTETWYGDTETPYKLYGDVVQPYGTVVQLYGSAVPRYRSAVSDTVVGHTLPLWWESPSPFNGEP